MFSIAQKRSISERVQSILQNTNHPELPTEGEIQFTLSVKGAESWSWAEIKNNAAVPSLCVNLWNERNEADQKWAEANQARNKAYRKWVEADQDWVEADRKWSDAYQERDEADQKWAEADRKRAAAGRGD